MKRIHPAVILLLSALSLLSGCVSYMHGYTKRAAQGQYLLVDATSKNFGYKRVTYIAGFRGEAIDAFIKEKGLPDYIYEFKQGKREGFNFYYLKERKAYVFKEESWAPDSARLQEIRPFNQQEMDRFGLKSEES